MNSHISTSQEWLEADGLGGFASGTAAGIRTRRYHSLLLVATTPPTGRLVLVNGLDAWVETPSGKFSLSSQCYSPGVIGGDGTQYLEAFGWEPWPHWIFKLEDGTRIEQVEPMKSNASRGSAFSLRCSNTWKRPVSVISLRSRMRTNLTLHAVAPSRLGRLVRRSDWIESF